MTVLVACETLLLVLLLLLVAGLLRSHAEILRRLGPPDADESRLPEPGARSGGREARDIGGTTLAGDALMIGLGRSSTPTLLAFLSSGCGVCDGLWEDLRAGRPVELPSEVRLVAVVKDARAESPARLQALAPANVPVVMSSAAWKHYAVPATPYFVYVEDGYVQGEGSASGWKQIVSLLRDANADALQHNGGVDDAERALGAAGIGPGHPSLYPKERGS